MLGGLAQAGAKALGGTRFNLINIMPAAFLVAFVTLLISSNAYSGGPVNLEQGVKDVMAKPGLAVLAVFGILVLALVLRPFQVFVVQMLEGNWFRWRLLGGAAALATERHRRIRHTASVLYAFYDELEDKRPATTSIEATARHQRIRRRSDAHSQRVRTRYLRYPRPRQERDGYDGYDDRLLPTLLGNTFRRSEDTAGDRYGLDLPVVAPRLAQYLQPKLEKEIGQSLDLIDATAALCVTFAAATLASSPLVWRWDWWSVLPLVMALLVATTYRGAVRLARGHGRLLETAFDLHRFDMIKGLHYELPENPHKERAFNLALSDFLAGSTPVTRHNRMKEVSYTHPSDDSSEETKPVAASPSAGTEPAGGQG